MLIPPQALAAEHGVTPNGVLHLGAHMAEEANDYHACGWSPVWWVEANPALIEPLETMMDATAETSVANHVVHALVGEHEGQPATLRIASFTQSSSVLPFGTHATEHPEVTMTGEEVAMTTSTVDVLAWDFGIEADFVNLDLQGYELAALRGAVRFLSDVRWVYTEVNRAELYRGCAQVADIDDYLGHHGFTRVVTKWTRHNWGDALYAR